MPYQPYQSTWNNPYMPQVQQPQYAPVTPSVTSPYSQPQMVHQQSANGKIMADGPVEAQNRLLMMYQPNQLVPGFHSDEVWDVNGKQFYSLSIENDGRRNFETFDYFPHKDVEPVQIDGAQFVSRQEYDEFVAKVSAALEAINGVHAAVPATVPATGTERAGEGTVGATAADNAGRATGGIGGGK